MSFLAIHLIFFHLWSLVMGLQTSHYPKAQSVARKYPLATVPPQGLTCAFMLPPSKCCSRDWDSSNLATFSLFCCSILMSQWELQSQFPVVNWQDWHGVVFSAVANLLQGTMCCVFKDAFPQHTCHVAHSEQPTESSLGGPDRQNCSGHDWGSLYG